SLSPLLQTRLLQQISSRVLGSPHVLRLQTLRPLLHLELHLLTSLRAFETTRLNCREVYEHILALLAADKSKALGVVKPLYCSLLCHVVSYFLFGLFTLERDSEVLRNCLISDSDRTRPWISRLVAEMGKMR